MDQVTFEMLRIQYRAALEDYRGHARTVAGLSKNAALPPADELQKEEQALYHLAKVRRAMLDALNYLHHSALTSRTCVVRAAGRPESLLGDST